MDVLLGHQKVYKNEIPKFYLYFLWGFLAIFRAPPLLPPHHILSTLDTFYTTERVYKLLFSKISSTISRYRYCHGYYNTYN